MGFQGRLSQNWIIAVILEEWAGLGLWLVFSGDGLEEPGGVGYPLFGPSPFVTVVAGPEVDAAAVADIFFPGNTVGDAACFGAMAIVRLHIGGVARSESIHKTYPVGVATKYPGELVGSELF